MKKIISLFQRNYDGDCLVRDEVVPGAEWVLAGEGIATRKWDGTCCMVKYGQLFKRYDAKTFTLNRATGAKIPWNRTPPEGFIAAQDPDPITGHWPGWLMVDATKSEDKWHMLAWIASTRLPDGTYELCGPKVQGNPEGLAEHTLIPHGDEKWPEFPRNFNGIRLHFERMNIEGVVWHHPDGRMVKIKTSDFGLKRRVTA